MAKKKPSEQSREARVIATVSGPELSIEPESATKIIMDQMGTHFPPTQVVFPPVVVAEEPVLEVVTNSGSSPLDEKRRGFLSEAGQALSILEQGNAVSPGELRRLLVAAVALLS